MSLQSLSVDQKSLELQPLVRTSVFESLLYPAYVSDQPDFQHRRLAVLTHLFPR